ncbi:MAG: hypothetical protein KDJ75_00460 [Alphaproteobacteria bacterium]|nr:hypothetical protein [Alphaproteobacteria bacterium]
MRTLIGHLARSAAYAAFILGMAVPFAVFSRLALAQSCDTDYEVIFDMYTPTAPAYSVWDTIYGHQDKQERFVSAVVTDPNHVTVAGERRVSENTEENPQLILIQTDERGRVVWEQAHDIAGLQNVAKMLRHGDGYIVAGQRVKAKNRQTLWLGFFDSQGLLLESQDIGDQSHYGPHVHDMIARPDGKGYALAASAQMKDKPSAVRFSVLYRLDGKGRIVSEQSYIPGVDNRILGLSLSRDGHYLAAGSIRGANGIRTGWLLKLTENGEILWQRAYPRGIEATFTAAKEYSPSGIIVTGEVSPADGSTQAGWIALLKAADGEPLWQRYYTGEMNYTAYDVLSNEDGLIAVALDARKPEVAEDLQVMPEGKEEETAPTNPLNQYKGQDYIRLLTLNRRGVLLKSEVFFNGEGLEGVHMSFGEGQTRLMTGSSAMVYQTEDETTGSVVQTRSRDGWIAAASAMKSYKDPCETRSIPGAQKRNRP